MNTIFLALTVQFLFSFTSAQAFEITRLSHGGDEFNIPASICGRNGTNSGLGCKSFYAVNGARSCSCLCPARNATFAFYNKEWLCVENRALRRHLYQGKKERDTVQYRFFKPPRSTKFGLRNRVVRNRRGENYSVRLRKETTFGFELSNLMFRKISGYYSFLLNSLSSFIRKFKLREKRLILKSSEENNFRSWLLVF